MSSYGAMRFEDTGQLESFHDTGFL